MKRKEEIVLIEASMKEIQLFKAQDPSKFVFETKTGKGSAYYTKSKRGAISKVGLGDNDIKITATLNCDGDYAYTYLFSSNASADTGKVTTFPLAIYIDGEEIDMSKITAQRGTYNTSYMYNGGTVCSGTHIVTYILSSIVLDENCMSFNLNRYTNGTIKQVIMDDRITLIPVSMFSYSLIETIILPKSLKIIPGYAMAYTHLTVLKIPANFERLGEWCMFNTTTLKYLYLPKSILYIDTNAFAGCTNLTEIYYEGTMEEWNSIEKGVNWDGDSLATIHCSDGDITL